MRWSINVAGSNPPFLPKIVLKIVLGAGPLDRPGCAQTESLLLPSHTTRSDAHFVVEKGRDISDMYAMQSDCTVRILKIFLEALRLQVRRTRTLR